ncbi:BF3164 family lipoprotein [uncultured Rikenella sp.]|uniref:BF3164 family lipoprotein n=1 Tax=uncultured Rikenella sp. TaxID=368003 RepID=UPI00262F4682|nr:BF3164 family lipoprotein [uncultured Rikenella sp.]
MKRIIYGVLLLCAWSCQHREQQTAIDWTGKEIQLFAQPMYNDSTLFRTTWLNSLLIGNVLVACDFKSDEMLSFFLVKEDSLLFQHRQLHKGRGPNEMLIPFLTCLPEQNRLMIYEASDKTKLGTATIDTLTGTLSDLRFTSTPENFLPYWSLCPVDTNHWIGTGTPDSLFSVICMTDGEIEKLNPYPEDGCKVSDPMLKIHAYMGDLLKRPGEDRFVYRSEINRYMQIFDYTNHAYRPVAAPYRLYPRYAMAADGINIFRDGDALAGNLAMRVTSKYIYLLMNDLTYTNLREQSAQRRSDWSYASSVYAFDWEGEPVCRYDLDVPVQNILVDADDRYLYGVNDRLKEDDITVLRFALP